MTLQQIVNFIKDLSHKGNIDDTGDDITRIIYSCINMARTEIQKDVPNRYLTLNATVSSGAGTATISLASDLIKPLYIYYVRNSQRVMLKKVTDIKEWYEKYATNTNASQAPPTHYVDREYSVSAAAYQIEVYPVPDATYTYTFSYLKTWATELLGAGQLTSQLPELPVFYHDSVAIGGLFYFLSAFDDPRAQLWENRYKIARAANKDFEDSTWDDQLNIRLHPVQLKQY